MRTHIPPSSFLRRRQVNGAPILTPGSATGRSLAASGAGRLDTSARDTGSFRLSYFAKRTSAYSIVLVEALIEVGSQLRCLSGNWS